VDDLLVVEDVGAYDLSTAYTFMRARPPVVMITANGEIVLLRRAERPEDIWSLEAGYLSKSNGLVPQGGVR